MLRKYPYPPEGLYHQQHFVLPTSPEDAERCCREHMIFSLIIDRCNSRHDLCGSLGPFAAVIPREEAISPAISGSDKEISILSLVGRPVSAVITEVTLDENGAPLLYLSRKAVQEAALTQLLTELQEGDVIPAVVSSLSPVGVFADIGSGVIALLPMRQISVSRIEHPDQRFLPQQKIYVSVQAIDRMSNRFLLSQKELLGTFAENAAAFHVGETVTGIVRSLKPYGIFIELAPNLSGLAEADESSQPGQRVSVLIKAIQPERHKVKLRVISKLPPLPYPTPLHYHITEGNVSDWRY